MPEPVVDGLEVVEVQIEQDGPGSPALQRPRRQAEPIGEQGAVGEAGQLIVQGPMGQAVLLLVEPFLERLSGDVELADQPHQAAVATEPHHVGGHGQQVRAHRDPAALLLQHRQGDVAPGEVGLGHIGQYGILQDGLLALLGQGGDVLVGGGLVGGQPATDELGPQPGGDVGVPPELLGELVIDHRPHFVGPGRQGPAQLDALRAQRGIRRPPVAPGGRRSGEDLVGTSVEVSLDHRFHTPGHRQDLRTT